MNWRQALLKLDDFGIIRGFGRFSHCSPLLVQDDFGNAVRRHHRCCDEQEGEESAEAVRVPARHLGVVPQEDDEGEDDSRGGACQPDASNRDAGTDGHTVDWFGFN